jgi:ABC-type lipoprotein release transport system permease subunit
VRNSPIPANRGVVSLFAVDRYRRTGPLSYSDYLLFKSRASAFEWTGAARITQRAVELAGHSAVMSVADVTPSLARLFKLSLDGGVVISRRVWQNEFRGKTSVSGEHVRIGENGGRVVGVAPDTLDGVYADQSIDLWRPLHEASLEARERRSRNFWVLAGLRRHVSANRIENALRTAYIGSGELKILPYTGMMPEMQEELSRVGTLLRLATGFVFFIACVNVASFLLGRAALRSYPNSMRVALGVSRGRLVQAIVSDSAVIASAGGALSVVLAAWTSKVVPALLLEQDAEFLVLSPGLFSIVVASAAGVGIVMACGLLPLLEIRHDRPAAVLGREGAGLSKTSWAVRASLVIAQMTSCCLLVIWTGFLYADFHAALRTGVSPQLGQAVLATAHVQPDVNVNLQYFRDIEQAVRSLTGVSGLSWAARLPGSPPALQSFRVEPQSLPLREVKMDVAAFTSEPVAQFSWPPKAGRAFGFSDQGCPVAIVNEEAGELLFGDNTPGRSIQDAAGMPVEIIGVLADRKRGTGARQGRPTIYYNNVSQAKSPPGRIAAVRFSAPVAASLEGAELNTNIVSPGYFAAMGFSVVAGQLFPGHPGSRACRVAVVNQEAADLYFGRDAVGAAIIDDLGQRTQIIGVVHSRQVGIFQRQVEPTVYFPMAQDCLPTMTLIIAARVAGGPMLAKVQHALELVPGGGAAPPVVKTLDTHLSQTALAPLHIATALVGACATTALFLSVLGLYGTLSDIARVHRRDLAIRIALGARRRDVIRQILQEGGQLAGIGALAGVVGSLLLSQLLSRITSSMGTPKLWVWVAGPIVLAGVVMVAAVLPARRALMLDPLRVLRGN